ncbi:hypothetical protein [Stappia indica]|uniref:hypothetical protein n=1 Tax=Stappia indica TaxID=538381 RepID=UPI000836A70A|nr:hypothetical protein [Stappia indica]
MEQTSLTPDQTIRYLKARYNKSLQRSYLAKLRCTGGGAPFFKIGSTVLYDRTDLDNWVRAKRTPKAHSATQAQALQRGLNIKITASP